MTTTEYRVVVYRRAGVTMQTFNATGLPHALQLQQQHAGMRDVYKIELLAALEVWAFERPVLIYKRER